MKREQTAHVDVEQHVETHRRNVRRRITSENLAEKFVEGISGENNQALSSSSIILSPQQDEPIRSINVDLITELENFRVREIVGGEVFYIPKFVETSAAAEWYKELDSLDTWYHPTLKVYGKDVRQSRSIAAYATTSTLLNRIKYSGHTVNVHGPESYTQLLTRIQEMVERVAFLPSQEAQDGARDDAEVRHEFNHVMLNQYASGEEYIGKHRDNKENKVIASLSLGAERTFIMTPVSTTRGSSRKAQDKSANGGRPTNQLPNPHKWTLANGSLLIMRGDTQKLWKHEIPKEPRITKGRISLTFRQLDFGDGMS